MTKAEIQKFIIENPTLSNREISINLEIPLKRVGANVATLKRHNNLSISKIDSLFNKAKLKENNTFTNVEGEFKKVSRNIMIEYIIKSGVYGKVLTLPFTEWKIEKQLQTILNNLYFIGVENNPKYINKVRLNRRKLGINGEVYFGDLKDKLYGIDEDTYSHIIFDYCGCLTSFEKEIRYTFDNKLIKNGGYAFFTFNKAMRGMNQDDYDIVKAIGYKTNIGTNNSDKSDNRCDAVKIIDAFFHNVRGNSYQIREMFEYQDEGRAPMILVVVQRIK